MALSELQQATSLIDRASDLLLIVPAKASPDSLASLTALYLTLTSQSEHAGRAQSIDAVSPSHVPSPLQFLGGSSQITTQPRQLAEIILDLPAPAAIEHIRQQPLRGGVRVHVLLHAGQSVTKEQLEISVRPLPYDTALIIGALDLEELGPLFTQYTDFFYNTPLINLDHRAANEHFGTVNLVDITAGSCAEVAYELIAALVQTAILPDVATALYAGIVAGTDSFQRPSTTPRSFQVAARLIEHDADREAVIQHLVKTKPLRLIKLTGAIYARLRYEDQVQLYWTILEPGDFHESGASSADIPAAMQELTNNIAGYAAAFVLYEAKPPAAPPADHHYAVYLLLGRGLRQRRREIQDLIGASAQNGALTFTITAPSIEAAESRAHERIRQILP